MSHSPADERPPVGREATQEALIEATAQIMVDEGYAAATSRRVAAKAGVKPALVHYYFPSMDDLFVAVLRDKAEDNLTRQREAMANHRTAIRSEIVAYAVRFRDLEEGVVTLALKARGVDLDLFPPVVMSMIMGGLARIVLHERGLGITRGHDQATAFIERCLERFEMPSWDQQPGTAQLSDPARATDQEVTSNTIT